MIRYYYSKWDMVLANVSDLGSQFIQTTSCVCNKVLMEQQELKLIKTRIVSK